MQPISVTILATPDGKIGVQANTADKATLLKLLQAAVYTVAMQEPKKEKSSPAIEVAPASFIDSLPNRI